MLQDATEAWHGTKLNEPDWSDSSHSVALGAELRDEGVFVHIILSAFWKPLIFELPQLPNGNSWRRWIDTSLDSPNDIARWEDALPVSGHTYRVADRSVVMLYGRGNG
jgi:glycogen operon protein